MRACVRARCAKNATWARRGALRVTHDGSMCAANERAGCAGGSRWFGLGVTRARRSSAVVRDAFLALGALPAQLERGMQAPKAPRRSVSGSARSGGREGGDTRRGGCCARCDLKGLPLARRHKLFDGGGVRCKIQKKYTDRGVRTHAFEKTST